MSEHLVFPTRDGQKGYLFYYAPKQPYQSMEKPPLILRCHGGPTAYCYGALDLEIQFWTSRGFGFADVNYGGSSNYGRAYR